MIKTVKELVEVLQKLDKDAEIYIPYNGWIDKIVKNDDGVYMIEPSDPC